MAACAQFLHHRRWLSSFAHRLSASEYPALRFLQGNAISELTTVRSRYNLPTCSPPLSELTESLQANRDFYYRASGESIALLAAGYRYDGN